MRDLSPRPEPAPDAERRAGRLRDAFPHDGIIEGPTPFRLFRAGVRLRIGAEVIFREVEDRDLIARARRGNVDAYSILVSRWEKRIFNYLLRLVGNREDALDLSQDVCLKAYQNLKKLEDTDRFASWLFRSAHNEAYSLLRKNRPDSSELVGEPSASDATPRLYPMELSLAVERALSMLTSDQREAVLLKVY